MTDKHRIVITGGGTGGHIYPALSVYEQLKNDSAVEAILYIGVKGHLEERLTAERNIDFVGLESAGMPRKLSPALFAWPFKMLGALVKARQAMASFRPTAVLGTGGYASAPPLFAALLSYVPFAVHEPDAHPGLVNRSFAPYAKLCSLGMAGAASKIRCSGKVVINGNPIASKFLNPPLQHRAREEFGLQPDMTTLLITGGSQGAQAINDAVLQALPALLTLDPPIQILHQVGEKNYAHFSSSLEACGAQGNRYVVRPYINDLAVAYSACDLTLCRAGAMTIAELGVSGTPAIFIPYPFAAQNHQTHNARFVEQQGAALVLMQGDLNAQSLSELVRRLLFDKQRLNNMRQAMRSLGRPQAAHDLAQQIKQLSTGYQRNYENSTDIG